MKSITIIVGTINTGTASITDVVSDTGTETIVVVDSFTETIGSDIDSTTDRFLNFLDNVLYHVWLRCWNWVFKFDAFFADKIDLSGLLPRIRDQTVRI